MSDELTIENVSVVRQVYGFEPDEKRLEALSVHFESVSEKFIEEIEYLCRFLRNRG